MLTRLFLLILFTSIFLVFDVWGFEVTHQLRPGSTYNILNFNNSCSTISGGVLAFRCNPALFSTNEDNGLYISLLGKVDGDSVDNGRDLILSPVTEELLRKLFNKSMYNSFTIDTSIIFKTKYFSLSYSPYYLLADIFIINPAFPEISLNLVNREEIRANYGVLAISNQLVDLHVGGAIYYYKHDSANELFSLFELSYMEPAELVRFSTEYGVASDLGIYFKNNFFYDVKVGLQIKNLGNTVNSHQEFKESTVRETTLFLFERYSMVSFGKDISGKVGQFDINLEFPYGGFFKNLYFDHATAALSYSLHLVSVIFSLSKYYQNIGIKFNSKNMNVGISYSTESDLGTLYNHKERAIYTGVELSL